MESYKKNTVKAEKQLKPNQYVKFFDIENKGPRILFAGNSITLHGYLPDIGWYGEWGMAASSEDKDYVHLLMESIKKDAPDAAFCLAQVFQWESNYTVGCEKHSVYEAARDFDADIIIMRFSENCLGSFEKEAFSREYPLFVDYLGLDKGAKAVFTTSFWKHDGADAVVAETAKQKNMPCVYLGDLGEDDAMKAIGLFEHGGVANHPGDLGMQNIADRIYKCIKENGWLKR